MPEACRNGDLLAFWKQARGQRNNLFHCIGGLTEKEVFKAWGDEINNQSRWKTRILKCLNIITGNNFHSLSQASLFASTHNRVKQMIATENRF